MPKASRSVAAGVAVWLGRLDIGVLVLAYHLLLVQSQAPLSNQQSVISTAPALLGDYGLMI
jgi:hypothetical protein